MLVGPPLMSRNRCMSPSSTGIVGKSNIVIWQARRICAMGHHQNGIYGSSPTFGPVNPKSLLGIFG
jgi:hypothetical protein